MVSLLLLGIVVVFVAFAVVCWIVESFVSKQLIEFIGLIRLLKTREYTAMVVYNDRMCCGRVLIILVCDQSPVRRTL